MVNLIARRAIFKTKAGGTLRVTQQEAVVLRALQLADDVPMAAPVVRKRAAAAPVARELTAASTFAAAPSQPEPRWCRYRRWCCRCRR